MIPKMAQNLTMLSGDGGSSHNTKCTTSGNNNANENSNSSNTSVNFKPKDTNGWKDYKKLKTYLILKDQQSEKVNGLQNLGSPRQSINGDLNYGQSKQSIKKCR